VRLEQIDRPAGRPGAGASLASAWVSSVPHTGRGRWGPTSTSACRPRSSLASPMWFRRFFIPTCPGTWGGSLPGRRSGEPRSRHPSLASAVCEVP
jgi:hypothetical protein